MKKHNYVFLLVGLLSLLSSVSFAATITGRVWTDTNNNGLQDAGEPGRGGVIVRVLDAASRAQRGLVSTNGAGAYLVENVPAGSYIVHFANPGGVWQVKQDVGSNNAIDSDADALGFTAPVTLTATGTATLDAGFSTVPQGCFTPVTVVVSTPVCNNGGTPVGQADDTFTFSITPSGGTGPWGYDFGTQKMLPYDRALPLGPFLISGGPRTITINDHDNPDCITTVVVNPPAPCSERPVLTMRCPGDVVVTGASGANSAVVTYTMPTVSTTCPGGRTTITRTSGPASGSTFPVGETQVCFRVTDECGGQSDCCVKVIVRPTPSVVTIACPANISASAVATSSGTVVNYTTPTATTNCATSSAVTVTRISGPASGTNFPIGTTQVCFRATDACGASTSCCISVNVTLRPEPTPCDSKTVGCVRFELITVTKNGQGNLVYRMRVTNNCPTPLAYLAFEAQQGRTPLAPAGGSTYTAPSGRKYYVRNPSITPFNSIRFTPTSAGIASGASEIIEYVLPKTTQPWFFRAMACLMDGVQYQVTLNTFNCMVVPRVDGSNTTTTTPTVAVAAVEAALEVAEVSATTAEKAAAEERGLTLDGAFIIYPNPTTGLLMANVSKWDGQQIDMVVINSLGQQVKLVNAMGGGEPVQIDLQSTTIPNGIYYLQVIPAQGARETQRFVLRH
jgi:SdrD B-like domain/HYR domain/Secretion system C-terminal sorting domain